jgi:hypothetical protein
MTKTRFYLKKGDFYRNAYNEEKLHHRIIFRFWMRAVATIEGVCNEDRNAVHINLPEIRRNQEMKYWFEQFEYTSLEQHVLYVLEHEYLHAAIKKEDIEEERAKEVGWKRIYTLRPDEEQTLEEVQRKTGRWNWVIDNRTKLEKFLDNVELKYDQVKHGLYEVKEKVSSALLPPYKRLPVGSSQ